MRIPPRLRKLLGDIRAARGRLALMVLAIAIGIFGVGVILTAYAVLTRDIARNYSGTHPASAVLELDRMDDTLVDYVRKFPGITDAEAGSSILVDMETKKGESIPMILFVIPDFRAMRLNTFQSQSGAWPPPPGTLLLERAVLPMIDWLEGERIPVRTGKGLDRELSFSGIVFDPGLAPAWQGGVAHGYITPETLVLLGESAELKHLKISVREASDWESIRKTVGILARELRTLGYQTGEIRIPPPGKHPHQDQMTGILTLMLAFSLMTLLLSCILTAAMVNSLLSSQVRQIGIMKAVGAGTRQIGALYLVMIAALGLSAFILAGYPGIWAGMKFAAIVGDILNIAITTNAAPTGVVLVLLALGVLFPLAPAIWPILRYSGTTVREAISDYGIDAGTSRSLDSLLSKIRGIDRMSAWSIRNIFRKKRRLVFTLFLLSSAGAIFITGINIKSSWERYIRDSASLRHYDMEVVLNRPVPLPEVEQIFGGIPGIQKTEIWNVIPAAKVEKDGFAVVSTYPDGGHGSLVLRSVPDGNRKPISPLISGRQLKKEDRDTVVLNQQGAAFFPGARPGSSITLSVAGKIRTFRVAGIVREIISAASVYISESGFERAIGIQNSANSILVILKNHDESEQNRVKGVINTKLMKAGIGRQIIFSEKEMNGAVSGHVYIFIFVLLAMSAVMAVIGALAMMSTMGINVSERAREFGIIRTVGGRSWAIIQGVIAEGVATGLISLVLALVLSIPLSAAVGGFVGEISFKSALVLSLSPAAVIVWLFIIVSVSAAASAFPAWKASQLTIRETLSII